MLHRFREPEHPRIVDRGCVSDGLVSSKVYLAVASQDDGVGAVFVGCDAVGSLVDDAITVSCGRLEPPADWNVRYGLFQDKGHERDVLADLEAEVTKGVCSRRLRCSLNRPSRFHLLVLSFKQPRYVETCRTSSGSRPFLQLIFLTPSILPPGP